MNRLKVSLILCLALLSTAYAQNWEKKLEEQEKRIEAKTKAQQERVDLRFANQLKRIWLRSDLKEGEPLPKIIEPENPRVFDPKKDKKEEEVRLRILPTEEEFTPKSKDEKPTLRIAPVEEVEEEIVIETKEEVKEEINFLGAQANTSYFGSSVNFRYDPDMRFSLNGRITEYKIGEAWERLEKTEYQPLLYQITKEARRMRLNDWGFCLLINAASKKIYPSDKNAQTIFNWFILSKSGYISTVSYEKDRVFLLVPSKQVMYGKTYLKGKTHKLYAVDFDGNDPKVRAAKVFSHKYPETDKVLDLSINETPRLGNATQRKVLSFKYEGQDYKIPVEVNKNVIDFYENYPFLDLNWYMRTPLSPEARRSMVSSLKEIMQELEPQKNRRTKEEEQVHFLLRFVQNAFAYKTDDQQFGGEKYLFADETLYYPYSDCEDRSVLFSYLVREIVGLEVVGLMYPGHAATAVKFNRNVPGDYITYRGKKFTICDPTYVNATYGMIIPDVRGSAAKVVDFSR
ncbi:MAG: hypothetical protein MRZ79_12115 [Bacteroidia bacterium]|nr:hypothetical protein [Bacteroidia bacterium]